MLACLGTLVFGGGSAHDHPIPKPASGATAARNGGGAWGWRPPLFTDRSPTEFVGLTWSAHCRHATCTRGKRAAKTPNATTTEKAAQALHMQGCCVPTWKEREQRTPADRGWQKFASVVVDKRALELLFADLDNASRTLLLSESGEGASCVLTCERCCCSQEVSCIFTTVPSWMSRILTTILLCPECDVGNDEYRRVLLQKVRLPSPLTPQCKRSGSLDAPGDHGSTCAQVGARVMIFRVGKERQPLNIFYD